MNPWQPTLAKMPLRPKYNCSGKGLSGSQNNNFREHSRKRQPNSKLGILGGAKVSRNVDFTPSKLTHLNRSSNFRDCFGQVTKRALSHWRPYAHYNQGEPLVQQYSSNTCVLQPWRVMQHTTKHTTNEAVLDK